MLKVIKSFEKTLVNRSYSSRKKWYTYRLAIFLGQTAKPLGARPYDNAVNKSECLQQVSLILPLLPSSKLNLTILHAILTHSLSLLPQITYGQYLSSSVTHGQDITPTPVPNTITGTGTAYQLPFLSSPSSPILLPFRT